ncbi:MAG: hypothetical protein KGL39_05470 [Patescibacteria group bacterium]|nr:hypothetical protein [Patescibacteria group bacterium]
MMASTRNTKGRGMDMAITPDAEEVRGRSGMPHPPYSEGMGGPVGTVRSSGGAKASGRKPAMRGGKRR